jgi:hypothetical protein
MTHRKFEDEIDEMLASSRPPRSVPDALRRLPVDLRLEAEADDEIWQLFADRLWLHELIRQSPAPMPSPGFADRVVSAARVSPKRERALDWFTDRPRLRFGLTVALAAGIAYMVIGLRTPPSNRSAPGDSRPAEVVRKGEPATREAAPVETDDLLASVWKLANPGSTKSPVDPQVDRFLALVVPPRPVLGETIKHSTSRIATAGKNLSDQVRPLTNSVGGAFGFLLDLPPSSEKRSL